MLKRQTTTALNEIAALKFPETTQLHNLIIPQLLIAEEPHISSFMAPKHHVAFVPSPGMGHLIPVLELAKQLVLRHGVSVTFIVPTIGSSPSEAITSVLQGLPENINCVLLPPIVFEEGVNNEIQIGLTITRSLSSVREVFKSLAAARTELMALVVDAFSVEVFDVAKEFNVPSYLYFTSNATALSLLLSMPKLDEEISCEFRDMTEPVKLPGLSIPLHGRDFPEPFQARKNGAYKLFLRLGKRYRSAEGILINTFTELEPGAIKALQEDPSIPPVYPIGPICRSGSGGGGEQVDGSECITWLDNQPSGSVLFVSFGSGGTLTYDQLNELALGLELSEQKFLWVVRSPDDKSASASYLNVNNKTDPLGFLPTGFSDRTKDQGFLVPSWAPQVEVLSHPSTGGFLTHCGWNSTLESIVHGVPVIAWPLYAEQRMNAVILTEDLRVALRPKENEEDGRLVVVTKEEIAEVIKGLIMRREQGAMVRDGMNRLKDAASRALSEEGSSTETLSQLVLKWKNKK